MDACTLYNIQVVYVHCTIGWFVFCTGHALSCFGDRKVDLHYFLIFLFKF